MSNPLLFTTYLGLLMVGAAAAPVCQAALGGDMQSVRRDHEAIRATDTITSTALYDVHEGRTADGQLLREYVSRDGNVFALTWQGQKTPDLHTLLGNYAGRYEAAARQHRSGHHLLSISEPDFAVTVLRLPRGWQMQGVLPAAMPAGVTRAEIR